MTQLNSNNDVLLNTDFPDLQLYASGKVRDIYRIDNDHLLFVATDRISAFDYVLATGIPQKGRVLTQLSLFWFDFLKDIVAQPPGDGRRQPVSDGAAEVRRPAARPLDAGGARRHGHDRMRRARLSFRLGLEGIQDERRVCGIALPEGPARVGQAAGADLHPGDQGQQRARREYFVRSHG